MVEIPTTRICLVRHGETEWNMERRIQGQIDVELNATGLNPVSYTHLTLPTSDLV